MIEYKVEVFPNGNKFWYTYIGRLPHREDGPAIECADGTKCWYLNGKLHREDGPAVEYADGDTHWYLNGKLHREDGPAIERADGQNEWWTNGIKGMRINMIAPSTTGTCVKSAANEWQAIKNAPSDGRYVEVKCADGSWGNAKLDKGHWYYQFNFNKCHPTHFRLIK